MAAKQTYEKALGDLEAIVEKLSSGKLPLDEAVKLYEEGMKLADLCADRLNKAEQKISMLSGARQEDD